ncbi:hypothetical protein LSH36_325g03031 [Paralvinella palmiformis]|uniref:EF-hand domain-containing protein n=1 Tax=Paralvinella palmiformis TaxID=53620 RepID=A0AAD9JG59_9ANNE|nr:hypothetical protein LSH36_325g03031 [Paralvinella palmiformis]
MSFESIEEVQDVLLNLFIKSDTDMNGRLDSDEFKAMLMKGGYTYSEAQLKENFTSLDLDNDNLISLDEFLQAMTGVPLIDHRRAVWRKAFTAWDVNQTGDIDKDELKQVFSDVTGRELDEDELAAAFRHLDKDNNGKIVWEELASYLASLTKRPF